ncbi:protein psiP-like isoform X2 [Periplaneta americana]|uniref:protein psiP-like isoform X2 n=1 Tax=Periplaneta americana TaxID=6978 RepID=UPI0037E9A473
MACENDALEKVVTVDKRDAATNITTNGSENWICEPGAVFNKECNTCWCSRDGLDISCTDMECAEPGEEEEVTPTGYLCTPGTQYKEDCKTCWCSSDGLTSFCEPQTCPPSEVTRKKRGIEYALRCDPGEIFSRDCNICICAIDGIADHASCTIHHCGRRGKRESPPRKCKPGTTYKKDCNTCRCSLDGTSESCTEMACLGGASRKLPVKGSVKIPKVCEPGSTFEMDCNKCRCSDDGTEYACTKRACAPVQTVKGKREKREVEEPKVCEPGSTFNIDCNRCRCANDGSDYACTRKACAPKEVIEEKRKKREAVEKPKVCEPGSTFNIDCNRCRCADDGSDYICTLKACVPKEVIEGKRKKREAGTEEDLKVCEPGSIFNIECNRCRCANDGSGYACTRKACRPTPREVTEEKREKRKGGFGTHEVKPVQVCEPGRAFMRDCNICYCNAVGVVSYCTQNACGAAIAKRAVSKPIYGGCTPGSSWKDDCNTCFCGFDGYLSFCTLKDCGNEEVTEDDTK